MGPGDFFLVAIDVICMQFWYSRSNNLGPVPYLKLTRARNLLWEMEGRDSDEMGPKKIKKIKKEKKRIKKERAEAAILDGGGTAGFNLRFY